MTPEILQNALKKELQTLFSDIEFRDENDKKVKMKFFKQTFPRKESDDDTEPFPWCIIQLGENAVTDVGYLNQKQDILLLFGIYYDKADCQYQHVLFTLFERVKKRFLTNPLLDGCFSALPMMKSRMEDDEETYPYYFGAMSLCFYVTNYEREDD